MYLPYEPPAPAPAAATGSAAPPPPAIPDIDGMLRWLTLELRAERMYAWYRARRPHAFIADCPPDPN